MESHPRFKSLSYQHSSFYVSGATPNGNEEPQVKTLSTQSALFSLSVAYMKTGVGAVEKVAFQHLGSHLVTESHPSNSPSADKGETNYTTHSDPQ